MGDQIIRQPDGRYAVFSTATDTIHVYDATEGEIVKYFADVAAEQARREARRILGHVSAGEAWRYFEDQPPGEDA